MHPFLDALTTGLQATADPKMPPGFFQPGDVEHLKRWLSDPRAAAIFDKLAKGKQFTPRGVIDLIHMVLTARHLAETTDGLNATIANLKRTTPGLAKKERRNAMKQFADGKVSQEALDAYLADIEWWVSEVVSNLDLDSAFADRSDRDGSRKRTIFCRILSELVYRNLGRWHDAEVATLCEIALDCGDVTIDAVRAARRGLSVR